MKVVYKDEAVSIIKAMLYAEFSGAAPVTEKTMLELSLFNEPTIDADDLDIADLIANLRLAKKKPKIFSSYEQLKALENLIGWALRHMSDKKYAIIENATRRAINASPLEVVNGTSLEGKQLLKYSEEVQGELRLSGQAMRFSVMPDMQNVLYTRYTLKHDISDLVVQQWARIYPDHSFVLLLPGKTIIGNRFGIEEWSPMRASPAVIAKTIASSKMLDHPQRSRIASQHASYVNMGRASVAGLSYTKTVNYVDFYNKIKRGEELI